MPNVRHKSPSRSGVRCGDRHKNKREHSDMGSLRNGIAALSVLFGAAAVAIPAIADGGPPGGYEPAYYPSLWRGLYGGFHAGFGGSSDATGAIGGAQLGYNWQSKQLVYGIEGDITLSD